MSNPENVGIHLKQTSCQLASLHSFDIGDGHHHQPQQKKRNKPMARWCVSATPMILATIVSSKEAKEAWTAHGWLSGKYASSGPISGRLFKPKPNYLITKYSSAALLTAPCVRIPWRITVHRYSGHAFAYFFRQGKYAGCLWAGGFGSHCCQRYPV